MPKTTWTDNTVLKLREFNLMDMGCSVPVVLRSANGPRHSVYVGIAQESKWKLTQGFELEFSTLV